MIKGKSHQLKRAAFQQCPMQKYTTAQNKLTVYTTKQYT